jgi:lipoate-protein ligase A
MINGHGMGFLKTQWRLVITPPAPGAWNMAVDEAILEAVGRHLVPPTLRLYTWEPACLSIGYAQSFTDVDFSSLTAHGWHLVRRPTGGRAILHTDELTYSVAGTQSDPRLAGSVLECYRCLASALLAALNRLGVPAESQACAPSIGQVSKGAVCFEAPSNYEITMHGKKLVGSAQARRKEAVLQHGTIPLVGDLSRITQVLTFSTENARKEAAERLLARATTVESVLGRQISWQEAAQAFQEAFQDVLNLEFELTDLTPGEKTRTHELVREKYDHSSWTKRAV